MPPGSARKPTAKPGGTRVKQDTTARPSYFQSTTSDQRVIARPSVPADPDWVARNAPTSKFDLPGEKFFTGTEVLAKIHKEEGLTGVRCMAAVGEQVWVGEREGCFSVWNFRTGERLMRSTKKKELFVFSITGPVDGTFVWLGWSDGVIRIFDSETLTLAKETKSHAGAVTALTKSEGGRFVFSASTDFTVAKWDGESMTRVGHFMGHSNQVRALLAVGGRLYSGADDNTIRVWEIAKGRCVATLAEHTGGVNALAVAGKHLWSASEDNSIRIWDTSGPQPKKVRDLSYPHAGQIKSLCLIGSLMWSSSWNHVFIWDTTTFELKGQYDQAHETCVGSIIPVHQSVVTRVWSAAVESEICIWNTECTFASALHAATDSRLEAALLQIDEARRAQEELEAERRDLHEENGSLRGEVDRLQFTIDSQSDKQQAAERDLRRHIREAQDALEKAKGDRDGHRLHKDQLQRDLDNLRAKLAELDDLRNKDKDAHSSLLDKHRDLEARHGEKERELGELRALQDQKPEVESRELPPASDSTEDELLRDLIKALRDGDAAAAARIRELLDRDFPAWRLKAADIIVPHQFDANVNGEPQRLRDAFVQGMLFGPRSEPPAHFLNTDDLDATERSRRARLRQAYGRGQTASSVVPDSFSADGATFSDATARARQREAYVRGLGTEQLLPEDYAGDTPPVMKQRSAFLKGKQALRRVPDQYRDVPFASDLERERLRSLREAFLRGIAAGPDGAIPHEYEDSDHHDAEANIRRKQLREAFVLGQKSGALVEPGVPDTSVNSGWDGDAKSLDRSPSHDPVKEAKDKEGEALRAVQRLASSTGDSDGVPGGSLAKHKSELSNASGLVDAQDAYLKGLGAGQTPEGDSPAVPDQYRDDSGLDQTERQRRKLCRDAFLRGAAAAPNTITAEEADRLRSNIDELEEENARLRAELDKIHHEFSQAPGDIVDLRAQVAAYMPKSGSELDDSRVYTSPLAATMDRRTAWLRRKGMLRLGGERCPELPALEELDDAEQQRVDQMIRNYKYPAADSLPRWENIETDDQDYLTDLMSKYRRVTPSHPSGHSPASPPRMGRRGSGQLEHVTPERQHLQLSGNRRTPPGQYQLVPKTPKSPASRGNRSPTAGSRQPSFGGPAADRVSGSFVSQPESAAPTETRAVSVHLSQAAEQALDHPQLPPEARSGLKATVLTQQENAPMLIRKALSDPAITGGTATTLRETLETADAGRAVELSSALRRATQSSQLPPDTRKQMQGALDSKDRAGKQNDGVWADTMTDAARRALQHPGLPAEVRQDLGQAVSSADGRGAEVAIAARAASRDPGLSAEARVVLQQAALPRIVPSAVPEAVRDILHRDAETVPEKAKKRLTDALQTYDGRVAELATAVRSAPGRPAETLKDVINNPTRLPGAVQQFVSSPHTSPDTKKALEHALKRWQGQQEAVDDAARYVLSFGGTEALPVSYRQRLRAALQQGGAGAQEVAEAVRFVLANYASSIPRHVEGNLRVGLAASDGRNAPLQQAVRNALETDLPDDTRAVLSDGLATADGLTPSVALNLRKVDTSKAPGQFQKKVRDALHGTRGTSQLVQTCATVATSKDTPQSVSANLGDAVAHYKSRGDAVQQAATEVASSPQAFSPELSKHLNGAKKLDVSVPEQGIDAAREALLLSELGDEDRRQLQKAIAKADAAYARVRPAAAAALEAVHPHRLLADSIAATDSESRQLMAGVRDALAEDATVPSEVRAKLHDALRDAEIREGVLIETVRDVSVHHPRISSTARRGMVDALAVSQGRPQQVISAARKASRDPQVPINVRRVLLEALGEDPTQVAELAFDAVMVPGMPKSRQDALTDALAVADASDAALIDAVRSVVLQGKTSASSMPLSIGRELDSASNLAQDSVNALMSAARSASFQRDVPEEVAALLSDENTGHRPEKVVDAVRSTLRAANVPLKVRNELQASSTKTSASTLKLADNVRAALADPQLPKDAPSREVLSAALHQWEQGLAKLTEQAQKAAADPRVPPTAREELASVAPHDDKKKEEQGRDLVDVVRFVVRQPGVPPSRQRSLSKALSAVDSDRSVEEALRITEKDERLPEDAHKRASELRAASGGNRRAQAVAARALLESSQMPQDNPSRQTLGDALSTSEGFRVELLEAARNAAQDPSLPEVPRRMLQEAVGQVKVSDQALTMRAVLQQPGIPDEVRKTVQKALDEETRTPIDQAWRFQREHLKQEMEAKMRELGERLRQAEEKANDNQRAADLVKKLGGVGAAQALADGSKGDDLKGVSDAINAREKELADLKAQIAAAEEGRGEIPPEFDPNEPGISEAERRRRQRLLDAYNKGKAADCRAALPEDYRGTDPESAELAGAWLRGRQEGLGSIVPYPYADVEGLSDEERYRRRLLRGAFWDGLSQKETEDEPEKYHAGGAEQEAFRAGNAHRSIELRRLGAPLGLRSTIDTRAANVSERFQGGLHGAAEDLTGPAEEALAAGDSATLVALAAGWCRGRWLRIDVLGSAAADFYSPLDRGAGSPHSPMRNDPHEAEIWRQLCSPALLREFGFDEPTPEYLKALQAKYEHLKKELAQLRADMDDTEARLQDAQHRGTRELQDHLESSQKVQSGLQSELDYTRQQIERERKMEVQRLQSLIAQLESDLERKEQQNTSLSRRMQQLTDQLSSGGEAQMQQELVARAFQGNVDELVQYYKEREKKWREMAELNAELMQQNDGLVVESQALAQKLHALSFVFSSRPTLIRSLYELYKVLAHIIDRGGVVDRFSKEAARRQLPRLDILQRIKDVCNEVEVGKEGSRWIIANLFTAYELQHLGTSPSFFVPDGRRPTWRDIQVPPRVREHLLRQEEEGEWITEGSPRNERGVSGEGGRVSPRPDGRVSPPRAAARPERRPGGSLPSGSAGRPSSGVRTTSGVRRTAGSRREDDRARGSYGRNGSGLRTGGHA
eukprot:Hpha_TRINITY_DN15187_c3_g2::TRINITY_DN15187_c3_g2_i1::g.129402::m.129402